MCICIILYRQINGCIILYRQIKSLKVQPLQDQPLEHVAVPLPLSTVALCGARAEELTVLTACLQGRGWVLTPGLGTGCEPSSGEAIPDVNTAGGDVLQSHILVIETRGFSTHWAMGTFGSITDQRVNRTHKARPGFSWQQPATRHSQRDASMSHHHEDPPRYCTVPPLAEGLWPQRSLSGAIVHVRGKHGTGRASPGGAASHRAIRSASNLMTKSNTTP